MFGWKKKKQKIEHEYVNLENNNNKMDDEQKAEFLRAMGVKTASSELQKKEIEPEENTELEDERQIFKSRAERRALSDGYTRPVAPIPVQAEDVNKVTQAAKVEQTTIKMNFNQMKNVTINDLYDTLAEVQDYQSSDYTEDSWLPFVTVFTQALTVYQADDPTAEEILIARDALLIAKGKLVKVD